MNPDAIKKMSAQDLFVVTGSISGFVSEGMSYCRWSCDNHKSDLYCYSDVSGGWTTHVAGRKRVGDVPDVNWGLLESGKDNDTAEWTRQYKAQQDALDKTELVEIGLPHDGECFNDPTLEDFRARIVMLKEAGYHVPDWVLPGIDEEIAETTHSTREE